MPPPRCRAARRAPKLPGWVQMTDGTRPTSQKYPQLRVYRVPSELTSLAEMHETPETAAAQIQNTRKRVHPCGSVDAATQSSVHLRMAAARAKPERYIGLY